MNIAMILVYSVEVVKSWELWGVNDAIRSGVARRMVTMFELLRCVGFYIMRSLRDEFSVRGVVQQVVTEL